MSLLQANSLAELQPLIQKPSASLIARFIPLGIFKSLPQDFQDDSQATFIRIFLQESFIIIRDTIPHLLWVIFSAHSTHLNSLEQIYKNIPSLLPQSSRLPISPQSTLQLLQLLPLSLIYLDSASYRDYPTLCPSSRINLHLQSACGLFGSLSSLRSVYR